MTKARHHPLLQLVIARLREFWREPAAVFWVYGFPLLMMVALGVAFRNRPVERPVVAVEDSEYSEGVVSALEASDRFVVMRAPAAGARQLLGAGRVELLVIAESETDYAYHFDPTKPGALLARNSVDDALQRAAGRVDVLQAQDIAFEEPGGRYIDFLIPGLIGMGLLGGGLWGVGFAVVDLRLRKLLKRFMATPMKRTDFLLSVMISRLVFTIPEVLFLIVIASVLFGVENRGSTAALTFVVTLGAFQFSGIGLLVAARIKTLETAFGLINLVTLPLWIGSGIFFPADRFPAAIQPLLNLLPLKPLIDAIRATMMEGTSLLQLWPELTIVTVWTVVTFVLSLITFRWE